MIDPAEKNRLLAKKLVMLSHIFGWGGLGFLLVLAPMALFALSLPVAGVVAGIGGVSAFAGAILGQVGRGMQGRVI